MIGSSFFFSSDYVAYYDSLPLGVPILLGEVFEVAFPLSQSFRADSIEVLESILQPLAELIRVLEDLTVLSINHQLPNSMVVISDAR